VGRRWWRGRFEIDPLFQRRRSQKEAPWKMRICGTWASLPIAV
jgi:hypothetical protein